MPAVLQVGEFEQIACGVQWNAQERVVTSAQRSQLERISESFRKARGKPVFANGPRGSLVAQNFVGVVCLGRYQVEVLPKVGGAMRKSLLPMIATTLDLVVDGHPSGHVAESEESILEPIIRMFCSELWTAVRRGIVHQYVKREENLVVMRGKLQVANQLRHNLARMDRLHCEFDEFSQDNRLNRLLKAAVRLLLGVTRSPANARSLSELLFCFQEVADISPVAVSGQGVKLDRLSERYRPLVELALLFLQGASPDVVSGGGHGFALLFDMNELFEEYVGRQVHAALRPLGFQVTLQGPKRHLARSASGSPAFELRPDIVNSRDGRVTLIIDTKWKRLNEAERREGVSSADAYQMFAYAERYDAQDVVLLYPHHPGLGAWTPRRAHYDLGHADGFGRKRVAISTVDLASLWSVRSQLLALVAENDRLH